MPQVLSRAWGWFKVRSTAEKFGIAAGVVLVGASRMIAVLASLAFSAAMVAAIVQWFRRRPVKVWASLAGASLIATILVSGIVGAAYRPASEDHPQRPPPGEPHPAEHKDSKPAVAEATSEPSPTSTPGGSEGKGMFDAVVTVKAVESGDIIRIDPAIDGRDEVRLIGVHAPETEYPCGKAALTFAGSVLRGEKVWLEFDARKHDPDSGRMLAYVYPEGGEMFNERLLRTGYARVSTNGPNTRYEVELRAAQESAQRDDFGVWGLPKGQRCTVEDEQPVQNHTPRGLVTRPNFVFILADDMRYDDLKYMPKTSSLLKDQGMSFTNAFVSISVCCPSRATIMRGQYAHNTGVWSNHIGPDGGWEAYRTNGNERDNVATRLDDAGYRTGFFGKYLNHYDGTVVPPGWDRWYGLFETSYLHWSVNDDGVRRHVDDRDGRYETDVLRDQTQRFIGNSVASREPFFAYVGAYPPHTPAIPAPRDAHVFDGLKAPQNPAVNETDVSDKPPWIRRLPELGPVRQAKIDRSHEYRAETLQGLDDLVAGVIRKLQNAGAMRNTYVLFTSDNGWEQGEHRIPDEKARPYEESIHMPLLVRGPGVAAGSTTDKLALNTDYLPTLTDLADIRTPGYVDGRSLRPVLEGDATGWRDAVLLERLDERYPGRSFFGIRTSSGEKYLAYQDGFRESYDLTSDPYELNNSYRAGTPPAGLASRLRALKGCSADTCRAAEHGP